MTSAIDLSKLTANDDLTPVLGGYWPGIQIYYPPIKFNPLDGTYESMEQAKLRLQKHAYKTKAHTVLFDLEDGCRQKAMSRELLIQELPKFPERNFQIAVRINPFRTDEYEEDLKMLKQIHQYIDVIVLAKAGEVYGSAEIRDLSSWLVSIGSKLTIQPIIEHPKSLQIADRLMEHSTVKHVVFGIHDFSKAMAYKITPKGWIDELETFLRETSLKPGIINPILETIDSSPVDQAYRAAQILTRPNMTLERLETIEAIKDVASTYENEVREQAEINIKYKGYIEKEKENVAKLNRLETIRIPEDFDYSKITSLSAEAKQKMGKVKPKTIAQAGRISGVSPADINVLLIYLGR